MPLPEVSGGRNRQPDGRHPPRGPSPLTASLAAAEPKALKPSISLIPALGAEFTLNERNSAAAFGTYQYVPPSPAADPALAPDPMSQPVESLSMSNAVFDFISPPDDDAKEDDGFVRPRLSAQPTAALRKPRDIPEIQTPDGIYICSQKPRAARKLEQLCADFPSIWKDTGIVNVPEKEQLKVPLVDRWYEHRVAQRPYPLGIK